jgi:hypothetical protein
MYQVKQIPGLQVWIIENAETGKTVGPRNYTSKLVADVTAADLNFQHQFDTNPEFRAEYIRSVQDA